MRLADATVPRRGFALALAVALGATSLTVARADLQIDVPFATPSPIADGIINPGEYGPGLAVDFTGHPNPGQLFSGSVHQTLPASQLSFSLFTAYTATDLFLAFQVTDPAVPGQQVNPALPFLNDAVEVFVGGTPGDPNFTPPNRSGDRGAFQLIADRFGDKLTTAGTPPGGFTNADWTAGTRTDANGYVVEFDIPLGLIRTPAGIAGPGSQLLFNAALDSNDTTTPAQQDQGILFRDPSGSSPFLTGEPGWSVRLNLTAVPEPSSVVLCGLGAAGLIAALRGRATIT